MISDLALLLVVSVPSDGAASMAAVKGLKTHSASRTKVTESEVQRQWIRVLDTDTVSSKCNQAKTVSDKHISNSAFHPHREREGGERGGKGGEIGAVSYTHLTLPTNRLV